MTASRPCRCSAADPSRYTDRVAIESLRPAFDETSVNSPLQGLSARRSPFSAPWRSASSSAASAPCSAEASIEIRHHRSPPANATARPTSRVPGSPSRQRRRGIRTITGPRLPGSDGRHRDLPAHCQARAPPSSPPLPGRRCRNRRRRQLTLCNRRAIASARATRFAHGRFPYAAHAHTRNLQWPAPKTFTVLVAQPKRFILESGHKRRRCSSRQSWVEVELGAGRAGRLSCTRQSPTYHGCHNNNRMAS